MAAGSGVPTQVLETIWKSPGSSSARALLPVASARAVIVSGASPLLVIVTGTMFEPAGALAAADGNVVGSATTVPVTAVPTPLRLLRPMSELLSEPPSCSWW